MANLASLVVTLGVDASEFQSGLDNALSATSSAVASAGKIALSGTAALAGGLAAAATPGLQFNNTMEMVTAQLNAFTKDGAKSAAILDMIKTRAAATPFAFEDMAQAATALLPASKASGVALEDLIKKAEILGASNPAEGLAGAAFSLKEALSGDFTSIIERFNLPRQYLNELKAQGVPALQAVQMAMEQLGLDADLVSNLANTASGRWSTFKDTLVGVSATATKPIFDIASNGLATMNTWLSANQPLLDRFGAMIAGTISTGLAQAATGFNTLMAVVTPLAGYFSAIVEDGDYLNDFLVDLPASIQPVALAIGTLMTQLAGFDFGTIFAPAVDSAQSRLNAIVGIVNAVFGVISTTISQYGGQIAASTGAAFEAVLSTASAVFAGVNNVVTAMLGQVAIFIQNNGQQISDFVAQTWLQIADIVKLAMDLINATVVPILSAIGAFIASHSSEIQTVLTAAWTIISTVITTALDTIKTVITVALQVINGDWSGAWNTIQQFSARFVQSLITIIQSGVQVIAAAFTTAVDVITGIWGGLATKAVSFGKNIIDGVVNGVRSAADRLYSVLSDIATSALNAAKSALGIASPSKRFEEQVGVPSIVGIIVGMQKTMPKVAAWIKGNLGQKLSEYLKSAVSFARGQLDIFRDLVDLNTAPDTYKPLADAQKAYNDALERSKDIAERLADTNQAVAEAEQRAATTRDEAGNYEAQLNLNKLLQERADLIQEQTDNQKALNSTLLAQQAAEAQSNNMKNDLLIISENARRQYEEAQARALELMKTDAKAALEFFNQRKAQIAELADLQKQRALATDPRDQEMLDTQIKLLEAVQNVESAQMTAQLNIAFTGGDDKIGTDRIIAIINEALRKNGIKTDINYRTA